MKKALIASTVLVAGMLVPVAAHAYVGPGAGISLLGALWVVVVVVAVSSAFILTWPVRQLLRRRRARGADRRTHRDDAMPASAEPVAARRDRNS